MIACFKSYPLNIWDYRQHLLLIILPLLFLAALGIRLYNLDAPGILPEREFRSMFIARADYYEHTPSIPAWRKEIALISKEKLGILEPPILELFVAQLYRLVGGEQVWLARVLTALFWVVGGLFFYRIAQKIMGPIVAVIATAYYLFVPLGILISRSFQPDSLMIMLFLASLFTILWYDDRPSLFRVVIAAAVAGLTLLVKPLPLFTIFGAFIALAIYHRDTWRQIIDGQFLVFVVITLLPAGLYYTYGLFVVGFLENQAEMSFRPDLLLYREFWEGWVVTGVDAVGYTALLAGLLGWAMQDSGRSRALLTGLWLGYGIFGLVFTHHIHTHSYYHLQLVVILGLSFGPLLTLLLKPLRPKFTKWQWATSAIVILFLVMFFNIRDVRAGLHASVFESKETAQEIGKFVHHSSRVVLVARHYGQSLEYFGELSGAPWPKAIEYWLYRRPGERELSIEERLEALGFVPEYFVITDFDSFDRRHPDLKEFLNEHCALVAQSEQYLIYDGTCVQ